MEQRFLLDTNTVIYYCNGTLPMQAMNFLRIEVDKGIFMSVISEIETLGYEAPNVHETIINAAFVASATVIPLTRPIVVKTIELRKNRRKLKLPDAIIAATALIYDFILVSKNDSDFKNIPGLKYLNPFTDL